MKYVFRLLALSLLLLPVLIACAGSAAEETQAPLQPEGPALVMFYTDN